MVAPLAVPLLLIAGRTVLLFTRVQLLKMSKKQIIILFLKMQKLLITRAVVKKTRELTNKTKRKRKFSPAQLRAQRLFAKRSRAGTLRRR